MHQDDAITVEVEVVVMQSRRQVHYATNTVIASSNTFHASVVDGVHPVRGKAMLS